MSGKWVLLCAQIRFAVDGGCTVVEKSEEQLEIERKANTDEKERENK